MTEFFVLIVAVASLIASVIVHVDVRTELLRRKVELLDEKVSLSHRGDDAPSI
ncbi:hypothetical protein [Erythrobacter litoralis]|uniref:hypothetical protein n=1 Tax=Erythrobacter litoralis TaxID=39960 RepID=UPI0013747B4F|nr:hypothetical protein [Erythrobacter litoralis]